MKNLRFIADVHISPLTVEDSSVRIRKLPIH